MRTGSWLAALAAGVVCANALAGAAFTPLYGRHYALSLVQFENGEEVRDLQDTTGMMPQSLDFVTIATAGNVEVRSEAAFQSGWDGRRFFAETDLYASTRRVGSAQPFNFDEAHANTQVLTHADFTIGESTPVTINIIAFGRVVENLLADNSFSITEVDSGDPYMAARFTPSGVAQWNLTLGPGTYRVAIESFLFAYALNESALGASGRSGMSIEMVFVPAPGNLLGLALFGMASRRRR